VVISSAADVAYSSLEIDGSIIKRNARLSATVALAGMILPFGFGAALSVPLYHKFIDESVKFSNFLLFTAMFFFKPRIFHYLIPQQVSRIQSRLSLFFVAS
jgi:hypothetical protein